MKKCQWCAEEIQDGAVICRFCGRSQVGESATASPMAGQTPALSEARRSPLPGILALVGAGLLLAGSLIDFGGGFHLVEFSDRPGKTLIADVLFWWLPAAVGAAAGVLSIVPGRLTRKLAAGLSLAAGVISVGSTVGLLLYGDEAGAGFFLMLGGAGLLTAAGIIGIVTKGGAPVPVHV
jgi:hypothetical protein